MPLLAAAALALLPGCSIVLVNGIRADAGGRSVECTSSPAAPIVDTVFFAGDAAALLYNLNAGAKTPVLVGNLLGATLFGASAIHGYSQTAKCRDAKRACARREELEESRRRNRLDAVLERQLYEHQYGRRVRPRERLESAEDAPRAVRREEPADSGERRRPLAPGGADPIDFSRLWSVTPDGSNVFCPTADRTEKASGSMVECTWGCLRVDDGPRRSLRLLIGSTRPGEWRVVDKRVDRADCPSR